MHKMEAEPERGVLKSNIERYRIYPASGKVDKANSPPPGAAIDREGWKNDAWRPMPDWTVKLGGVSVPRDTMKQALRNQMNEPPKGSPPGKNSGPKT
jgi:hypothetical protein